MGFNDRRSGGFGGGSRGGFGGGRGGFGGGRGGGFRDRGPREMHDATCTKCNKACQVPFKPTGDKPVLCSDCFRDSDSGSRGSSRGGSSGGMSQDQFKTLNAKLDKILEALNELEVVEGDVDDEDEEVAVNDEDEELVEEGSDKKEDLDEDLDEEEEESLDEPKSA